MNRWTRRGAASSRSVLAALAAAGGVALAGCAAGQAAQTAEQQPTVTGANIELGSLAIRNIELSYPEGGIYLEGSDARLEMVVVNEGPGSDALVEVRTDAAGEVRLSLPTSGEATGPTPTVTAPPPSPSLTSSETGLPNETNEPATPSATAGSGEPSEEPAPSASGTASPVPSPAGSGQSPTPTPTPQEAARVVIPANGLVTFEGESAGATAELLELTEELRPTQVITITLVFANAGEITTTIPVGTPEGEVSLAPTVPAEGEAEAGAEIEE